MARKLAWLGKVRQVIKKKKTKEKKFKVWFGSQMKAIECFGEERPKKQ